MKKFKSLILALILSVSFSFPAFAGELTFPFFCWYDSSGYPLASGKLYSYVSGTSTEKLLYSDKSTTTPHTNPEILDTNGCTEIYGLGTYTLTLKDSTDTTTYFSIDGVVAGGQGGQVSYYYPNYDAADNCATGNSDTIKYAIDTCSTDSCTIYLANNSGSATTTYTCTTSETIPDNIKLKFENGAKVKDDAGNATLTIRGPIDAGAHKIFDWGTGSGTVNLAGVAASGGKNLNPTVLAAWFVDIDDADHTADIQMAIDACDPGVAPNYGDFTSGQTLFFHPGTYEVSDTINLKSFLIMVGAPSQGQFGEGNNQKTSVVFNSSINNAAKDIFKFAFLDIADVQYGGIILESFTIQGSGNERDGIRVEGWGRTTNWLMGTKIKDVSIMDVGNDGIHFNHYATLFMHIEGLYIWNPGNNGFTWESTYSQGSAATGVMIEDVLVNSPDNYAFYLNPISGATFKNCKNDGSGGTLSAGWYLNGALHNLFIDCDNETYSPATGDAWTLIDSERNTWIEPQIVCANEGGMTFVNSPHNVFHGGQYYGDAANTTNFITFDAASYNNKFHNIIVTGYDYDDFVADVITAGSANSFHHTRILNPGTMIPATSPWSTWFNSESAPDIIVFGNSALSSRRYTIFSDVMIMGRILPYASNTAITSLTSNTLDAQHLTVKTITLAGADDLDTISNGNPGQLLTLIFRNGNTTLKEGANLQLAGQVDFTPTQNDVVVFVAHTATQWFEVSRSENHN